MKYLSLSIMSGLLVFLPLHSQKYELKKIWETDTVFFMPESAAYDSISEQIFVSNFNILGGFRKAGDSIRDESVSIISLDGKIVDADWCNGLLGPTGIKLFDNYLWAVERGYIEKISLQDPNDRQKFTMSNYGFPNDIVFDKDGNAYITDSQKNHIYKFDGYTVKVWLTDSLFSGLNCLYLFNDTLLVGNSSDNSLLKVSLDKVIIEVISKKAISFVDGITADKERIIISGGRKIKVIEPDNNVYELIDSGSDKEWYADFEYIAGKNIIVVPTLYTNKVVAFKVIKK